MKRQVLILIFFLIVIAAEAATLKVNTRDFTSEPTMRRRTTLTLVEQGPVVAGPWLIVGDSVGRFTDTNGIAWYSNVLAGAFRLDVAGTPGRSYPITVMDTNGILDAAALVNTTNLNTSFYTAAQVDALLAGIEAGGGSDPNALSNSHTAPVTLSSNLTVGGGVVLSATPSNYISAAGDFLVFSAGSGGAKIELDDGDDEITVTGALKGNGSGLTALNANSLASGTIPDARFPATLTNNTTGNAATATLATTAVLVGGVGIAPTNFPILNGTKVIMPESIYGANANYIGIGTNGPNSMDVFGGYWRHLLSDNGMTFFGYNGDGKISMQITKTLGPAQPTGYNSMAGGEVINFSDGFGKFPAGAGITSYQHLLGGDASALRALPIRGPEMWSRMPFPFVHIVGWYDGGGATTLWAATNITSKMVTNMVSANVANGLLNAFTNRGIPLFVQIDAVWMATNRSAAGNLQVNSNQFPAGIEPVIAHAKAAGFPVQLGYYWDSHPTNYFTVDPAGNQGANLPRFQTMTPFTVNNDILQAYNWGVNAIRMANTVPFYNTAGFQNQMFRQVADAVMNPGGYPWRLNYSTNAMIFNALAGDNVLNGFSETMLLGANYVEADNPIQSARSPATELSDIFTNAVYLYDRSARLCGKGHFPTGYVVADPNPSSQMSTNAWRTKLSFGAMWGSGIQFNTNTPVGQVMEVTNSRLMEVYFDSEQHPAWLFQRDLPGNHLGAVKPLANGAYALWLFNDGLTNYTWSLNLSNLFNPPGNWTPIQRPPAPPSNPTLWRFTDIWQGTNYGYFDNFRDTIATITLPASNSTMIICKPVWFQEVSFAQTPMGYTYLHYPGDGVADTGTFDGEFGMWFPNNIQSVWATPKLPSYTTNATISVRFYTGAATSAWTNTISPQYVGGTTRFWNSGGVSQTSQHVQGSSSGMSNLTMTATFPVTNAPKWVTIYNGTSSNALNRFYCDPIRIIAE